MLPNTVLIEIWYNLVDLKETYSEFSRSLTLEVSFNCWCLSEVPQEYFCLYPHLNFVSVELTSLVFHQ